MAELVLQPRQQMPQRVERVVDATAVGAGVQIARRAGDVQQDVAVAAQTVDQRRAVATENGRVGDEGRVGGQQVVVIGDEGAQIGAADLLFSCLLYTSRCV